MYGFDGLDKDLQYLVGYEVDSITIDKVYVSFSLHGPNDHGISCGGKWKLFDENESLIDSKAFYKHREENTKSSYNIFCLLDQKIEGFQVLDRYVMRIKFSDGYQFEMHDEAEYEICSISPNIHI